MEKETNNIITKNIKNYNNFSYHQHQEIEKKENEKIEDFQSNFTSNEIGKDIFNKLLRLIKKEVFWAAVPLIFSTIYFILNISYKFSMKNKFKLPMEYFKVDLIETLIYLFFSIIFMGILLLFLYMLKKAINDIFNKEIIKDIIYILLQFIFIIVGVLFILPQSERFMIEEISIIFVVWITFFISNFLSENILEKGILYFSINCFLFSWIFYQYSQYISFIFLGLFFMFFLIFFTNNMWQVDIQLFFIFSYAIIYLLYIPFYLIFIIYIASFVMTERTEYEIFYKDRESKIIITTYGDKYLIMDCDYNKEQNQITTIYTKNYEFIDINQTKEINYINSSKEPIIEKNKPKNNT